MKVFQSSEPNFAIFGSSYILSSVSGLFVPLNPFYPLPPLAQTKMQNSLLPAVLAPLLSMQLNLTIMTADSVYDTALIVLLSGLLVHAHLKLAQARNHHGRTSHWIETQQVQMHTPNHSRPSTSDWSASLRRPSLPLDDDPFASPRTPIQHCSNSRVSHEHRSKYCKEPLKALRRSSSGKGYRYGGSKLNLREIRIPNSTLDFLAGEAMCLCLFLLM